MRPFVAQFIPAAGEIIVDIEEIQNSAHAVVDHIVQAFRARVEGRKRRGDDAAHLGDIEHILEMRPVKRRFSDHEHQTPALLERHVGGSGQEIAGHAGRDLGERLHRARGDHHAERAKGPGGRPGADIADRIGLISQSANVGRLQIGLIGQRHFGWLAHDQMACDRRHFQRFKQADTVDRTA